MRKRAICILTLLMLLSAAGCARNTAGQEEQAESGPAVYYLNEAETGFLTARSDTTHTGEEAIRDLFNTLKNGEFSDGHSAVPSDLELDHTAWQENSLVLYLTGRYPEPGTAEETFCRAALTFTLLSAAEADSVVINVDNHPLTDEEGVEVGAIRREDFVTVLTAADTDRSMLTLTLYFAAPDGKGLVQEKATAVLNADEQPEAVVMDQLLRGPQTAGNVSPMPAGGSVLGVSVRERICYVNLSEAFRNPDSGVADELMIYAIVNSLGELETVDKVQITVNGSADVVYDGGLSISAPLEPDLSLVEE